MPFFMRSNPLPMLCPLCDWLPLITRFEFEIEPHSNRRVWKRWIFEHRNGWKCYTPWVVMWLHGDPE